MAGIAAWVGVHHLLIYLRCRQRRRDLSFALTCFLVAVYDVLSAGLYNAETAVEGLGWQRLQVPVLSLVAIAYLFFVADVTERPQWRPIRLFGAVYAVLAVAALVAPRKMVFSGQPLIRSVDLPLGVAVTYHEMAPGLLSHLQGLFGLIILAYSFWVAGRLYSDGSDKWLP